MEQISIELTTLAVASQNKFLDLVETGYRLGYRLAINALWVKRMGLWLGQKSMNIITLY